MILLFSRELSGWFDYLWYSENQEQKQVRFLDPFDSPNAEASFNSLKVREQGSPLLGSSETEKGRSVRCNLRKSLAWDNAFFTSEGMLLFTFENLIYEFPPPPPTFVTKIWELKAYLWSDQVFWNLTSCLVWLEALRKAVNMYYLESKKTFIDLQIHYLR